MRLQRLSQSQHANRVQTLHQLQRQLQAHSPDKQLTHYQLKLSQLKKLLENHTQQHIAKFRSQHAIAARALNTVSPLATLDRGFAVVRLKDQLVTSAKQLKKGDKITVKLAEGEARSTIDSLES